MAWSGKAWRGGARFGTAGPGMAGQGKEYHIEGGSLCTLIVEWQGRKPLPVPAASASSADIETPPKGIIGRETIRLTRS